MMNRKGQFSIIAAMLVAVVLIAAVMATYSTIRYNSATEQPQILSAIDETNLSLKEILGFTVGYYGSVLKVTGNMTYAQQLATNYLKSGLNNIGEIRPEWGTAFELTTLSLNADWFSNKSYSQGTIIVNYNLTGLGLSGVSYSTSTRLDVEISNASSPNQAQLTILRDEGQPLINLGRNNLNFYSYDYLTSNWALTPPTNIASYANGTYVIDLPLTLLSSSYVIQVEDTRGLMVLASSFSEITSTLAWNTTGFRSGFESVETTNCVTGTQSDFAAQAAPDGVFNTLNEQSTGIVTLDNYPSSWALLNSATHLSGALSDLQSDDGAYLQLRSRPVAYNTITFDSQNSTTLASAAMSMSWQHTTSSGNDRILLVSVDIYKDNSAPTTITSITYDGVALTQVASAAYTSSNPQVRSYVYSLTNPSSGTKTITVNFAASTLAVGGSITYNNVNQATPVLTSNTAADSGSSQTVSVTASDSYSKILFGHLGTYRTASPTTYTVNGDPGQASRWSQTGQLYRGFGSDKTVTSGSMSVSWTTTRTVSWVAIAVLLEPTPAAGTTFIAAAEFTGTSNTETWTSIVWTLDASASASNVNAVYQLYNYRTGQYMAVAGDGYLTDTLGASDTTKTQTITSSLTDYRDAWGNWKLKVNATQTTLFDLKLDLVRYSINQINYALNVEEQWLTVNSANLRQDLCVKTGASASAEPLVVQVWHASSWQNLTSLYPNYFNNVSLAHYIDSSTLKIRFVGYNDAADSTQDNWSIDSVYLKDEPDPNFLINLQDSTFTLEVLQNGTMRWIGQNLLSNTQTLPIPPVPVKAIHVNQTINGVNQEVPFQVEDWASNYQIPLGLTSNSSVFSNRQMIVFLLNSKVSDFSIWWDGNDNATQTPLAYINSYFTFNPGARTLSNSKLQITFSTTGFTYTSTVGSVTSSAAFMRFNGKEDTTDPELSYPISTGVVRDIVLGEAEFSNGITNCSNTYTNIVITMPANVNYYTYQTRVMFLDSTPRPRNISDLCPVRISTTISPTQTQTENGTLAGFPTVQNDTATFSNYTSGGWTAHHFSQFISSNGKGVGIMFTDGANQRLYAFDSFSGSTSKGALKVSSSLLELLPVSQSMVKFTYAYDITWIGAIATWDGTTPMCGFYDGTTPTGLWLLAEYPPTITVTAKS